MVVARKPKRAFTRAELKDISLIAAVEQAKDPLFSKESAVEEYQVSRATMHRRLKDSKQGLQKRGPRPFLEDLELAGSGRVDRAARARTPACLPRRARRGVPEIYRLKRDPASERVEGPVGAVEAHPGLVGFILRSTPGHQ